MTAQQPRAGDEWRANWTVVLAAMLGMSFYATVNYSFDQFAAPVEQAFGLSRKQVFTGLSIFNILPVLFGPFVGALIDRFGARRVAIPGLVVSIATFAALSQATGSFLQWCLLWLAFGICALLIKSTVWTVAVTRLFNTSRGMALSVMLSGTAIAEAAAKIYPNWLVMHHGWRFAYVALATSWGGLALLLVLLFFRDTQKEPGLAAQTPSPDSLPGLSLAEAMRSPPILRVGLANLISSFIGGSVAMHISLVLKDAGLDRGTAAMVAATSGLAGIVGKLVTGWLCDRTQSSWLWFTSFGLSAIGYALLLNPLHSIALLTLGVMLLGYGGGASFQVTAYLTGRYGGLRNFGKLYGTMGSAIMLGAAIGPVFGGVIHDAFGGYRPLIMAGIPIVFIAALLTVRLGPFPNFVPVQADASKTA
jgi:MFS family permease